MPKFRKNYTLPLTPTLLTPTPHAHTNVRLGGYELDRCVKYIRICLRNSWCSFFRFILLFVLSRFACLLTCSLLACLLGWLVGMVWFDLHFHRANHALPRRCERPRQFIPLPTPPPPSPSRRSIMMTVLNYLWRRPMLDQI